MDQFVTRFLLRETVNQLQALQTSLEGAADTLEAQARGQRYVKVLLGCGCVGPFCFCIPYSSVSCSIQPSGGHILGREA